MKTIYYWLYSGVLKVGLEVLRHKGKYRKHRETRGAFQNCTSIHDRPQEVQERQTLSQLETDITVPPGGKQGMPYYLC